MDATVPRHAPAPVDMNTAGVHHIALRTGDLDGLVGFYQDLLALEIVRDERPRSVWLGLGPACVLMVEARSAAEPGIAAGSMELLALAVDDAGRARVRERSMELACFDGETEHTVYARDPDGRRVGASTYRFES